MNGRKPTTEVLPRLKKAAAWALLALIALGLNFHLLVLQIYGWSGMLIDYRESTESWSAAARITLSGEAPCDVCRHVDTAFGATDLSEAASPALVQLSLHPVILLSLAGSRPVISRPPTPSGTIDHALLTPTPLTSPPAAPPPRC